MRPLGERHAGGHTRVFGVRGDTRRRFPVAQYLHPHTWPIQRRRDQNRDAPGPCGRVHARLLRHSLHAQLVHPVHMHLARLRLVGLLARRRRDQHVVVGDVQHGPDVQLRSRERPFPDRQHPRTALVRDPDQLPGRAPARHPGEKIKPCSIFVGVHHPRRARLRIHRQDQLAALVARLYEQ